MSYASCAYYCNAYVDCGEPSFAYSGWPIHDNAQKADFAVAQGIAVEQVKAWVGWHIEPHASDVHDMVVVKGVLTDFPPPCNDSRRPGLRLPANSKWKVPLLSVLSTKPSSANAPPTDQGPRVQELVDMFEQRPGSGDAHPATTTGSPPAVQTAGTASCSTHAASVQRLVRLISARGQEDRMKRGKEDKFNRGQEEKKTTRTRGQDEKRIGQRKSRIKDR